MRTLIAVVLVSFALSATAKEPPNPVIDSSAYLRLASQAVAHREPRRVSEDEFMRLARTPGVVILDARSRAKFDALHVKGAINLSFPDITIDSLNALLPDKDAIVLIYCNNNFRDAPDPMPSKLPPAALNLATYTSLYIYGYRNVYELGPNLSVKATRIPFEGTGEGIR
jgi:phage shock protein E